MTQTIWTVAEAVAAGAERLEKAGIDTPRLDAELLVGRAMGWDRTRLYTYPERLLNPDDTERYLHYLRRRENREPLPYILGQWEFYHRSFIVTPDVLIPRPETELLVEGLLERRPWGDDERPLVADVGTGSGCIGLTLAAEAPEAILFLTDVSASALEVARDNARRLDVEERTEFRHAEFPAGLDDLSGRLDVLASNPPYIAESDRETLPPEVRKFEPTPALFSGPDGLHLLRQLLAKGLTLLKPGGWIALEFGIGQSEAIRSIAEEWGYCSITIQPDYAGIPRALFARTPFKNEEKE